MMFQSYIFQWFWRYLAVCCCLERISTAVLQVPEAKRQRSVLLPGIVESKRTAAHDISCCVKHLMQ